MAKIDTKELFEQAEGLRAERTATLEKQRANREILRNLDIAGLLSDDESALLEEYYPIRTRERAEDDPAEGGE